MNHLDYYYHLTSKSVGLLIKKNGMQSLLTRTGSNIAAPDGSFYQERKQKEAERRTSQLATYIFKLISQGYTEEQIIHTKGESYLPMQLVLIGSNKADIPKLEENEKQKLESYYACLPAPSVDGKSKVKTPMQRETIAQKKAKKDKLYVTARSILNGDSSHFLGKLATDYISNRYRIEELITTSHIYFIKPEYLDIAYRDYTKRIPGEQVMLRVKKTNMTDVVNDDSEFRAVMTKSPVAPNYFDVMTDLSKIIGVQNQSNPSNWMPLSGLT